MAGLWSLNTPTQQPRPQREVWLACGIKHVQTAKFAEGRKKSDLKTLPDIERKDGSQLEWGREGMEGGRAGGRVGGSLRAGKASFEIIRVEFDAGQHLDRHNSRRVLKGEWEKEGELRSRTNNAYDGKGLQITTGFHSTPKFSPLTILFN